MAEQKFIDGVKAFKPKADFIKAELVISLNQFVKFCKENTNFLTEYNGEKQLKIHIKESSKGIWYAALNDYKPKAYDKLPADKEYLKQAGNKQMNKHNEEIAEDLPF